MATYFMGIDNGGTITKAVIFDREGREVASASRKLPLIVSAPGWTERDMEELWAVTCAAIRDAIESSGIQPSDIRGVGCTGHGKGLYLWGKNGRPVRNGIVSTDSRAWKYVEAWKADGTIGRAYPKTCQQILACQPVALLRWLKDEEPESYAAIRWIFEVKDYIRFRLTGEAFAEITDYSGSGLMNIAEGRFDRELLELFGLGDMLDRLPPLKGSADACGMVAADAAERCGLASGTPVAGGMFDIDACALAMDVLDERRLCIVAGTWSINEYIAEKPVTDGSVMMNSLFCLPGRYLVEESSPTSAGNNEWFADLFLDAEQRSAAGRGMGIYELESEIAASVGAAEQSIVFLPYVFGSDRDPRAKACFVGMDASATRAQLVRAVFEGVVMSHMTHVERLLSSRSRPEVARLAGGAARSELWTQIFADVFGMPVETVEATELGALGAAMVAAVAAGEYADLREAASRMTRLRRRHEPDPALAAIYAAKFRLHKAVAAALSVTWKDF